MHKIMKPDKQPWNIYPTLQVLHSSPSALPTGGDALLAALPSALLLMTDTLVAAYNTTGAVSRHGPLGIVASSIPGVTLAAGLMVTTPPPPSPLL